MPQLNQPPPPSSLNLHDILSALFKHKKLIAAFALIGFAAAAAVFIFYPPLYESNAKLLVRYVLDRSAVDPVESAAQGGGQSSESVMNSEAEILTSWDLATQVADAVGVNRLVPNVKGGASRNDAAATVSSGLEVTVKRGSNIIFVVYKNRNPELATVVLDELVKRYFEKHLEVHRSAGAFDFVTQQTDSVRARLNQTEDALKNLKGKAGIVSMADSMAALSTESARIEDQLHTAEAELAEQKAKVQQMDESPTTGAAAPKASPSVTATPAADASTGDVQQYQALLQRLVQLRQTGLELSSKYTPTSLMVKLNRTQIDDLDRQRKEMERKFPDVVARVPNGTGGAVSDLPSERARLAGVQAKAETLRERLKETQGQIKQLTDLAPQMADLDRNRELEETNYKYFKNTLEKARIDEALDPSKIPNISAVQRPTPPSRVTGKRNKTAIELAAGGLALGIALSLLRELFFNRTIRRPLELETQLRTPLLMSIPMAGTNGHARLPGKNGSGDLTIIPSKDKSGVAPWEANHFIRPYAEAIRDRLGLYFELNSMTHKPKLVGVTGFTEGAGTSTLAAGLAAALSEMGDGKVLLVDVNLGPEEVHPFFKGRPALPLSGALQPADTMPPAAENLYLATVAPPKSGPAQLGLKRFFDLMPNLKASDFDYIIFDMPPLTDTSPTMGIAGFLDKTLLIVEAEESNREAVKRGYRALVSTRDNVSVVLNKARSYVPKWLDGDS